MAFTSKPEAIMSGTCSDLVSVSGPEQKINHGKYGLFLPLLQSKTDSSTNCCLAEPLLTPVAELVKTVASIDVESESFLEIGSLIYRASAVMMDLHLDENYPKYATDILQSIYSSFILANDLTGKFQKLTQSLQHTELTNTLVQLETVINNIGEYLSLIPSSGSNDCEYVEIVARALSKEMKATRFVLNNQFQNSKQEDLNTLKPSSKRTSKTAAVEVESDLYAIDVDVSMENLQSSDVSCLYSTDLSTSIDSRDRSKYESWSSGSLISSSGVAQYVEPLYETFFCPLTKKIMEDPVTVESGVTYERKAIIDWISRYENTEEWICPKSGQHLRIRTLSTNMALRSTIDEWKDRNEASRIKVARAALTLASTHNMIVEAMENLQSICQRKQYNKVLVRNAGIIPLLIKILEHRSRSIRCSALDLLRQLAEDDDEGKDMIAKAIDLSIVVKMLSTSHRPLRHASVLLLLELSKSCFLCDIMGTVAGCILMLVTLRYRQSNDAFISENADAILKNLERSPNSIKCMAENGHWEPLLNHLIEGSEETKMEMAGYLGEFTLGQDCKSYVAERASPALIQMVQKGNSLSRHAAFKALKQISSHHPNNKVLLEAGIVQIMLEEMFARTIHNEPMNSKNEAAAVLANILESGLELENLEVKVHGHTIASDYVVYNIIQQIKNSTVDELNINLIRILLCLMKFPKSSSNIVAVIKETEASYNLIELVNNPNEEVGLASIKLLISLSPFMGHTLSERLCKTRGQPENLLHNPTESSRISEKHAVSANLLAKLPRQNLTLNLALLNKNMVPTVLQSITQIQRSGTRTSRYANAYLEALIGILVRFTATLYDHQVLLMARDYNFTSIFTELLMQTSSDEIQKLSAIGLENLSNQSINLSRPPATNKAKFIRHRFLQSCLYGKPSEAGKVPLCPVHRGVCSSQETFCLIDAKATERLLACLDHENAEVVEAALSAIATLLDDKLDTDKSVNLLTDMNAMQHVLNVVKDHREEALWQKSFWLIEKFLSKGGDDTISDVSQDRLLPGILVSAYHHRDGHTRQMAEKVLMHLNKIPHFTASFTM